MECLLLCYNNLRALQIEIAIFISSILGVILTFLGLLFIPFEIDSKIHKLIFLLNYPLSIFIIIISMIFFFCRIKYIINDKYNIYFYFLSLFLIILCVLELILNLVNNSLIINNMYYNDYFANNKLVKTKKALTKIQWIFTVSLICILIINLFSLILLSLSENLRINLQIDGSYSNYLLAIKKEEEYIAKENEQNSKNLPSDSSINNIKSQKKEKNNQGIQSSIIFLKEEKVDNLEVKVDNNKEGNKS